MSPAFSVFQQVRGVKNNPQAKGKGKKKEAKTDRKGPREFQQKNLKDMEQYALCDAMRYVCLYRTLKAYWDPIIFDIVPAAAISGPWKSAASPQFRNTKCTFACGRGKTALSSET